MDTPPEGDDEPPSKTLSIGDDGPSNNVEDHVETLSDQNDDSNYEHIPIMPNTPSTPVSPGSRKSRLLHEQYKQRYIDCKKEKEVLKAENKELLKKLDSTTTVATCVDRCIQDEDEYKLECHQCKKLFHYRCTGLPAYQLTYFLTVGYRRFVCQRCTVIPDYFTELGLYIEHCPSVTPDANNKRSISFGVQTVEMDQDKDNLQKCRDDLAKSLRTANEELSKVRSECKKKEDYIKEIEHQLSTLQYSEESLRNLLEEREKELDLLQNKINEKEEHSTEDESVKENTKPMQDEIDKLKVKLKTKEADLSRVMLEATKYQNEGKNMKEMITALQKESEGHESRLKSQRGSEAQNDTGILMGIDDKLEAFSAGILSKVTEIIEQKMGTTPGKNNVETIEIHDATKSPISPNLWSSVVSSGSHGHQDIKTLMRDARNDEKIEVSEKEKRAKNIIIHGADELGENPEEIKKQDLQYVKEIFNKIGVKSETILINRLGEKNEERSRPIKIVFKTKAEKDNIMKNLGKLKGTERYFGKISIKDDFTAAEREEIRLLTERAKKQSEDNQEKTFKVRGNSKNGWRVVSFPKKR